MPFDRPFGGELLDASTFQQKLIVLVSDQPLGSFSQHLALWTLEAGAWTVLADLDGKFPRDVFVEQAKLFVTSKRIVVVGGRSHAGKVQAFGLISERGDNWTSFQPPDIAAITVNDANIVVASLEVNQSYSSKLDLVRYRSTDGAKWTKTTRVSDGSGFTAAEIHRSSDANRSVLRYWDGGGRMFLSDGSREEMETPDDPVIALGKSANRDGHLKTGDKAKSGYIRSQGDGVIELEQCEGKPCNSARLTFDGGVTWETVELGQPSAAGIQSFPSTSLPG